MDALRNRLARIADLDAAAAVLEWDQETYMPDAAAPARARQVATLRETSHELLSEDETGRLLDTASPDSSIDEDLIRVCRHDYDRATRIPATLVGAIAKATGLAKEAWKHSRADDDFAQFEPHLDTIVTLSREKAAAVGFEDEPYDALLDEFEPGMPTSQVVRVFDHLRSELVPLVEAIADRPSPSDAVLHRYYPPERQWEFGVAVMREFGYDFDHGRQDHSAHPFTTTFAVSDVRVTTHIHPHHFSPGFFGSLHEAGHGMYEQGVDAALDGTLLASGTSLGVHESQSRLWENLVGRSLPFWRHQFPRAQAMFPGPLADCDAETFYGAVNRVEPSLIRIEADEVTYNLHIMVRFELERAMVRGDLATSDIPDAWNDRMESFLGLRPASQANGCLQDIHWSLGILGYFPTYALGNLMSSQLWNAMTRDIPDVDAQMESGSYGPILEWMQTHVHAHGRRRTADQILNEACGSSLDAGPWLAYVKTKFGALYGL